MVLSYLLLRKTTNSKFFFRVDYEYINKNIKIINETHAPSILSVGYEFLSKYVSYTYLASCTNRRNWKKKYFMKPSLIRFYAIFLKSQHYI